MPAATASVQAGRVFGAAGSSAGKFSMGLSTNTPGEYLRPIRLAIEPVVTAVFTSLAGVAPQADMCDDHGLIGLSTEGAIGFRIALLPGAERDSMAAISPGTNLLTYDALEVEGNA